MRISDWSSDVCSSDLLATPALAHGEALAGRVVLDLENLVGRPLMAVVDDPLRGLPMGAVAHRSAFVRGDEAEFVGREAAVAVRISRLVGESALGLLALIPVLRVLEPASAALLTRSGPLRPLAFQILHGHPPGV